MKTIVGLFDDMESAKKASLDLENGGVRHDDISLVANNEGGKYVPTDNTNTGSGNTAAPSVSGHAIGHDAVVGAEIGGVAGLLLGLTGLAIPGLGWIATAGWLSGMLLGAGTGAVVGGLVGALTHVGVPHEDAAHYNEGVRRGGILLAVKAADEDAIRVAQILSDDGAVNIDERVEQYKREGYTPNVNTNTTTTNNNNATTAPIRTNAGNDEVTIPIVEEELVVGKRQVETGTARVYTHVTETPVERQVQLHDERVTVERRPVDRAVTGGDNAFQDGSYEVTEIREEPVISKQGRVVEEVTVKKEEANRTETVRDTVRRTEVDVDEMEGRDEADADLSRDTTHRI